MEVQDKMSQQKNVHGITRRQFLNRATVTAGALTLWSTGGFRSIQGWAQGASLNGLSLPKSAAGMSSRVKEQGMVSIMLDE